MTNLDYYLTEDHAARRKTTLICVVVGAVLGLVVKGLSLSLNTTTIACVLAAGAVEFGRALTYKRESRKVQRTKPVLSRRRYVIQGAFSAAMFAILSFLRIPRAEAAIIERQLGNAANQDPPEYDKVNNLIDFAIQNSVPLNPAIVDATRKQVVRFLPASLGSGEVSRTLARLDGYALYAFAKLTLNIRLPVVAAPVGELPIHGPVYGRAGVSLTGADRNATKLIADFIHSPRTPGVLLYGGSDMKADALVTHMTVTWSGSNLADAPFFLIRLPEDRIHRVVVFDVTVIDMRQTLDGIIWVGVLFDRCRITYSGGTLQMQDVIFRECEFVAENEHAAQVIEFFREQGQNAITLRSR
jgi:hypothetical protein